MLWRNPYHQAYQACLRRAAQHYENFPVASRLLPGRLRGPIAAIYTFARTADDLADEDPRPPAQRRADLLSLQQRLHHLGDPAIEQDPYWQALADTLQRYALPRQPFIDLTEAFIQDLETTRYATFGEVMEYCRRSANPVGRLLLHLTQDDDARNLAYSDAVCSALQLINFYQDLWQDYSELGRIYIPLDEMQACGVSERHWQERINDAAMHRLMQMQYQRADRLLRAGAPLGRRLSGRMGLEIRAIINGGARVLWHLQRQTDPFGRPRLRGRDWWVILRHSI